MNRRGLLPILALAGLMSFLSCNDNSSSDPPPQTKLEDPNMPPLGTVDNHCKGAGASCGTAADCCGIGECIKGVCNVSSCIQNGEHCTANSDCCAGNCTLPSVGAGICH